jgi:diphthamide biosynthesis enzyme Dph1/Dph2-like protein
MAKKINVLYIEGKSKLKDEDYFIDSNFIKTLPKEVLLAYSIQFKGQAQAMRNALEKNKIRILGFKQVLGCTKLAEKEKHCPILLIGNGMFHALNLVVQSKHPVLLYSNGSLLYSNGSSRLIGKKDIEAIEKKKSAALSKFFSLNEIGILVSTKPGQEKLKEAEKLKEKILEKYPQKKVFIFISDSINMHEFQNFDINIFINTACPGLALDSAKILNIDDILPFLQAKYRKFS